MIDLLKRHRSQPSRPTVASWSRHLDQCWKLAYRVEDVSAQRALQNLSRLLGWQPSKSRQEANNLITWLLQDNPDDALGPVARMLFGNAVGASRELNDRRQAAAVLAEDVNLDEFLQNTEPFILSTLAFQILRLWWPESDQQSERPARPILPKLIYAVVAAFAILCGFSGPFHAR